MKIAGLLDKDTATAFRLAGIKDIFIPKGDTLEIWNEIIQRNDIGLILITERISEDIRKKINDFRLKNTIPIIIEIPDKNGKITDHVDYISNLIKKAVGVDLIKDK